MKKQLLAIALLCGITVSPLHSATIMEKWHQQKKHLKTTMAISLLFGAAAAGHGIIQGAPKAAATDTLCGMSAAMLWALLISNQGCSM